jgi:hypothetical protein
VLGVELIPIGHFGIPSGAVVSRLGARRTLIVCDTARAPLMASIPRRCSRRRSSGRS